MNKINDLDKELEEKEEIFSVSDVNLKIKDILKDNFPKKIKVVGEISNFKISKGNLYMTLKDNNSMINVVSWNFITKNANLKINNGTKVTITGYIVTYQKTGSYQINAIGFKTEGVGDLHAEYMLIKDFYESAGYFQKDKKKSLPSNLNSVGVVTALGGAALKDFLYVLEKNRFMGDIFIKGCIVQGNNCGKSVASCLQLLDKIDLDVIVITRGGGSLEDLFGFSDSDVIEEIYNTQTPIISAIGHEIDFMLSDFVADIRAPTPSIAAEILSSHQRANYNIENITAFQKNVFYELSKKLQEYELRLSRVINLVADPEKIKEVIVQENSDIIFNLKKMLDKKLVDLYVRLNDLNMNYKTSDPKNILKKGFCIIFDENNNIIKDSKEIENCQKEGKKLKIQFLNKEYMIESKNLVG